MTRTHRRPFQVFALTALLLLVAGLASANGLPKASPESVGMSSERLQRIGDVMESHLANEKMAGAMGMIARNGKVVYTETWGEADRENDVPMRPDTIFRIYSMTKPITSTAVMILYEEGKLFLNDPVAKYIPEFAGIQVAAATADGGAAGETRAPNRPMTVRDLLRHTSGLTYGIFGNTEVDQKYRQAGLLFADRDLAHFVEKLSEIPLQYEPGTRWHYSVSTDVLGRLVEVVSEQSFDEFLQERIFSPLGMTDTGFWVPPSKRDRFAQLYSPKGTSDGPEAWLQPNTAAEIDVAPPTASIGFLGAEPPGMLSGGGGLVSTASDYMRFCLMMLHGGELDGVRILSPKTIELITADHLVGIEGGIGRPGSGFGLGYAVSHGPGAVGEYTSEGSYTWGGAAGTHFWIDPEEELVGIYMVQILPHRTTLSTEFRHLTYQALTD